jgi:hypothetical protein
VTLDRRLGDEELLCDLAVREPDHHQGEDLPLARREPRLRQLRAELARQNELARPCGADGERQAAVDLALEDDSVGAGAEDVAEHPPVQAPGDDDDRGARQAPSDEGNDMVRSGSFAVDREHNRVEVLDFVGRKLLGIVRSCAHVDPARCKSGLDLSAVLATMNHRRDAEPRAYSSNHVTFLIGPPSGQIWLPESCDSVLPTRTLV